MKEKTMQQDKRQPRVLIVILNYKTYELTIELVKQLKELEYTNFKVLVIDNCSPNESARILEQRSFELNYIFIANDKNAGYAAGNNIGIRYGMEKNYEYSWILNNDVQILDKQILNKLLSAAEKDKKIACVGPEIVNADGRMIAPYTNSPTKWSMTLGIAKTRKKDSAHIGKSGKVYRVFGCCILLKNNYMAMVDCMDERTFLYCEEEILAERLKKVGGEAYYCAETSIIHLDSITVKKEQGTKNRQRVKTVLDSMNIYLKDYLNYDPLSRFICKLVRGLVLYLRE